MEQRMNDRPLPHLVECVSIVILMGAAIGACNSAPSAATQPMDESSLRPNGSRKLKVGFEDGTPSTGAPAASRDGQHDPGMMARPPEPPATGLVWTAPSAWRPTPPSSQMRLAQYTIPRAKGDDADGELAVFHLGASGGGGVDETFARWQASFDESAIKAARRSEMRAGGMQVHVLEIAGRYRPDSAMMAPDAGVSNAERDGMRLVGAIVMSPSGPYYFKLLGPNKTIAAARQDFLDLLGSCKANP
jgi:hypothetical protein